MQSYIGRVYQGNAADTIGYYYVFAESEDSVSTLKIREREISLRAFRKKAIDTTFFIPSSKHNLREECGDILDNFSTLISHLR